MFFAGVRDACAREIAYLRAHPWDLALISWFPALAMALAWAIFAQGVNVKLPLAFVDEDHSPGSRRLAVALEATRSTAIAARPDTLEDAWPLVRARQVYAVVHVPADWDRRAQRGDPMPIVLYTNEQYHAAGTSLSNDIVGAIVSVAGNRGLTALARLGGGFAGAERRAGAVRVELRTLYGPQLSFERSLAGAFLPTILHMFVLGGAAFAVGREFRDRTAGAWLESARGSILAAFVGKLLPLFACFAVLAAGVIAWLAGYRGWAANGSVLVWGLGLVTLIVACCAIPALIVGLTGTLRVTLALVAVTNVTAISFTGFTYPLFSMTTAAKVWSQIVPFHYFYEIQQQQWNIGAPLATSAVPFAVLWGVYIAVPLAIAVPLLAKRCRDPAGWGER
ncbi:MAG TPA: ABC transporter permease [Casimicrobiaceae bacterium]|nr:ABC transporter permease [Casimicrobiaceae bacterium]